MNDLPAFSDPSIPPPAPLLQQIDQRIQKHRHDAEQDNAHQQPIHLKYLTGINDQIPQPAPRCQKFPDHNPHQAEPDIDLHIADDGRDRAWKYDLAEGMPLVPAQGIDQLDLLLVHPDKAGIQVQDAPEDRHRHSGHDDGGLGGAQPYDQERRKGGLGQAVEHYQIRVQDLRQLAAAPEQHCRQDTDEGGQKEAGNGLIQGTP